MNENNEERTSNSGIKKDISSKVVEVETSAIKSEHKPNTQIIEAAMKKYHTHYQEDAPDYETGWMEGKRLSYKNQNANTKQYWRILYESTDHNDKYIGGLQDMAGHYLGDFQTITNNKITNTEIIFANPIKDSTNEYAYIGIGYHKWDRNIIGSGAVSDSLEKYSWKYIPIGYRNEYKINDKWDAAVDFSVRVMFDGKMKASNPGFIDPFQVNLGKKLGFKLEVPYTYHFNSNWSFIVNPWYEYWEIGQSNKVPQTVNGVPLVGANGQYVVFEPGSKTNQLGVDFGIGCYF